MTLLHLHPTDNVAIALRNLGAGETISFHAGHHGTIEFSLREAVPAGHKVALMLIPSGQAVLRYGHAIGIASDTIAPGDHVHDHNVTLQGVVRRQSLRETEKWVPRPEAITARRFEGYRRADGRVGVRNYVAVISTIRCAAHVSTEIARSFTEEALAPFPEVDGVIALNHSSGCSMRIGGAEYQLLHRTLMGFIDHPNIAAALVVGLGCETHQVDDLVGRHELGHLLPDRLRSLVIQDAGGTRSAIDQGRTGVKELIQVASKVRRTAQDASGLVVALQCGGSDSWSGVTANPVVGLVADRIVAGGGTVILSETPEIFGAEHLLTARAATPQIAEELVDKVSWWEERARLLQSELDFNPTPGNRAGGISTVYEKALGAVSKGGQAALSGVLSYAERASDQGLLFMDSPGYDPVSVTGQVAAGANLVIFTTGRGSALGFKPSPVIKVASNSTLFSSMPDDMDFDTGGVLHGRPPDELADLLYELVLEVASGRMTRSERHGMGAAEFSPWTLGEVL